MSRLGKLALCLWGLALCGCGAQAELLGTEGSYLLTAADALALPNEDVQLHARLQGGDLLRAQAGYVVRFYQDGRLFKAVETDSSGLAAASFSPPAQGDYRFTADVAPAGLADPPPKPQELLVVCRDAESPMAVVDLDKTVVASGFHVVLAGRALPMPQSAQCLGRLAETHTIVYLTHRPDYLAARSKAWLKEHGYPPGPVLLASIGEFLKGSGAYKSEALRELTGRFKKIEIGIGDKVSDAAAYHDNGLRSFLIIQLPEGDDPQPFDTLADSLGELPEDVQVVTGWDQITQALFQGGSFPRADAESNLREMARLRREKAEAAQKQ